MDLKKELKHKNERLNYEKFLEKCNSLRNLYPINLRTIQRICYPFSKTQSLGKDPLKPNGITFRLKNSKRTISIRHCKEKFLHEVSYFQISWTDCNGKELHISANSCKEIMYKINHVYKLTKPQSYDTNIEVFNSLRVSKIRKAV